MRKVLFIISLYIGIHSSAKACGGYYFDWPEYFHILSQGKIEAKGYEPFLRDDSEYESWGARYDIPFYSENINMWSKKIKGLSSEEIQNLLTTEKEEEFKTLSSRIKNTPAELKYIVYARESSKAHHRRKVTSWEYKDLLNAPTQNNTELIEEGIKSFQLEKDAELKLRYAYQVIRNFHYSKQYDDAIRFFNENVKEISERNEIYYYVLDQVAGCYYSLGDTEKAAYLFLQVFNNSIDRKVSSYVSYRFCTNKGAEGKDYFESKQDEAAYVTLKAIQGFVSQEESLEKLIELTPQDSKAELLFVRSLYDYESEKLHRKIGFKKDSLPSPFLKKNPNNSVLYQITKKQQALCTTGRKGFWILAESYLNFLHGDFNAALVKVSELDKEPNFREDAAYYKTIYKVLSWTKIEAQEEEYLAKVLNGQLSTYSRDGLILEYASHLYYKSGSLAKAFLIHNELEDLDRINSLVLLDDMVAFLEKTEKTSFEKLLIAKKSELSKPLDYVIHLKGVYYLNQGEPEKAMAYFKQTNYSGSSSISNKVFSNNIKECFECGESIMEDSVYLASAFSFIPQRSSIKELTSTIIQLENMTQDEKKWKQKLANYLLGNFYFNVSNTGYFRGSLVGISNQGHYRFFPWDDEHSGEMEGVLKNRKGFNLSDIADKKQTYYGLAIKAYGYYQKTITLSNDRELNARCLYMMAKCELNEMYNSTKLGLRGYNGNLSEEPRPFKKSFYSLNQDYQDTKFYDRIIEECSYFRYYCSN